jgi:hypothetical protein
VSHHPASQLDAGSQQPGFRCSHRDPEPDSQIAHRQLFHVKHHDVAEQRRNAPDLGPQYLKDFPVTELVFEISFISRKLQRVVATLAQPFVQMDESHATLAPDEHQALILHNPKEPSWEFGLALKLVQMLKSLTKRILRLFFRLAVVAQDKGSKIEASAPVSTK